MSQVSKKCSGQNVNSLEVEMSSQITQAEGLDREKWLVHGQIERETWIYDIIMKSGSPFYHCPRNLNHFCALLFFFLLLPIFSGISDPAQIPFSAPQSAGRRKVSPGRSQKYLADLVGHLHFFWDAWKERVLLHN